MNHVGRSTAYDDDLQSVTLIKFRSHQTFNVNKTVPKYSCDLKRFLFRYITQRFATKFDYLRMWYNMLVLNFLKYNNCTNLYSTNS